MLDYGYTAEDCAKFLGGNNYRVFEQVADSNPANPTTESALCCHLSYGLATGDTPVAPYAPIAPTVLYHDARSVAANEPAPAAIVSAAGNMR